MDLLTAEEEAVDERTAELQPRRLEEVTRLARAWLKCYLGKTRDTQVA